MSKRLVLMAAVLPLVCVGLVASPASARTSTTLTTWQWNVSGWSMHHGSTTDGMTAAAASSIVDRDADIAVFSEICQQQYDDIVSRLRAAGWPEDGSNFARFQTDLADTCGSGNDFGQAIFTRRVPGGAKRVQLPEDTRAESHYLLCVPLTGITVMACGVHVTIDKTPVDGTPADVRQLDAALSTVESYDTQGWTVLTGGDFNAQPMYGRMHPWYAPEAGNGGTGHYRELDDTDSRCVGYGEWTATGTPGAAPMCSGGSTTCTATDSTACAKVDMEFVRENRIAGAYSGDALTLASNCTGIAATAAYPAGSCSDHRVYIGTVPVLLG